MMKCEWVALLMAAVGSASAFADESAWQKARTEGLNLEFTPYFWAAGVDGKAQIGSRNVHFDQSFSDLIGDVDAGFMGMAIVRYDRFVLYGDYVYISLSDDAKIGRDLIIPSGTTAKLDGDLDIWTIAGGYRFDTWGQNTIDVMIGERTLELDTGIKVLGTNLSNDSDLSDTIVMLRPSLQLGERWRFNPTLSYGIAGDSHTTYELMPQVQYQFADTFALRFGYKRLFYKEDRNPQSSPRFEQIDTRLSGLFLGVGWTFPAHQQDP